MGTFEMIVRSGSESSATPASRNTRFRVYALGPARQLTVQQGATLHRVPPKDGSNLHECFDVIVRVEHRELVGEDGQQHDTSGPDVDCWKPSANIRRAPGKRFSRTDRLIGAFEEDFGGSEPSRTRTIRLDRRPLVVLGETDPAFAKPGALPGIVKRLLDRSSLGRFLLLP